MASVQRDAGQTNPAATRNVVELSACRPGVILPMEKCGGAAATKTTSLWTAADVTITRIPLGRRRRENRMGDTRDQSQIGANIISGY